jgi:protein-tyrosine kinase
MEKLQNALAKARESRDTKTGTTAKNDKARDVTHPAGPSKDSGDLWSALPVFTPDPATLTRNRIVTSDASNMSTHFDILRTKVVSMMRQNNWTRIAITSPAPACGKTTTACNLAMGLSRQGDRRTILFDLDLRRPGVARLFGMTPQSEVTALLSGDVPPEDQMLCINGNIAVAAAKGPARDPSRHLMSDITAQTLLSLEDTYKPDVMLFDLPPLLGTEDTRAFLKNVDAALLVVKAEVTTAHQIDMCEKEIAEHTNFLGVMLNQAKLPDQNTSHGYGYDFY